MTRLRLPIRCYAVSIVYQHREKPTSLVHAAVSVVCTDGTLTEDQACDLGRGRIRREWAADRHGPPDDWREAGVYADWRVVSEVST